jgi:hypothetical protein
MADHGEQKTAAVGVGLQARMKTVRRAEIHRNSARHQFAERPQRWLRMPCAAAEVPRPLLAAFLNPWPGSEVQRDEGAELVDDLVGRCRAGTAHLAVW